MDHARLGPGLRHPQGQLEELSKTVEAGPVDGVTRWQRVDLQRVIKERFDVDYSVRAITDLLAKLGFSHISGRSKHPKQDAEIIKAFKKTSLASLRPISAIFQRER